MHLLSLYYYTYVHRSIVFSFVSFVVSRPSLSCLAARLLRGPLPPSSLPLRRRRWASMTDSSPFSRTPCRTLLCSIVVGLYYRGGKGRAMRAASFSPPFSPPPPLPPPSPSWSGENVLSQGRTASIREKEEQESGLHCTKFFFLFPPCNQRHFPSRCA